jgi:polar amino acid transport system substrate-binding protein
MGKLTRRTFIQGATTGVIGVSLISACSQTQKSSEETQTQSSGGTESLLEKVKRQGYATIAHPNEIPYTYSKDGKLTGATIEVARKVFSRMGVNEVRGVLTEFQSLIPGVIAKRFDLTSTMYITPERCKKVAFSNPLWVSGEALITKADTAKKVTSYLNIAADPTYKVGYLAGGTGVIKHFKEAGIQESQLVPIADPPTAITAIKTGRIDGYVSVAVAQQALLNELNDPSLVRAKPFAEQEVGGKSIVGYEGFSFNLDDREFYEEFNRHLDELKNTPEFLETVQPFGWTDLETSPVKNTKAQELCEKES